MEKFSPIGKVQKTFGCNGEVLVQLYNGNTIEHSSPYFVKIDGLDVPLFAKTIKERGNKQIVVFESILLEEFAKELVGKELNVECDNAIVAEVLHPLMHYIVQDASMNPIGTITDWFEIPNNPLLQITNTEGNNILVPDNKSFIIKISESTQTVVMQLPEGLLDVN
ncbi:MAG: ribosome maturation factor RimM [Bacteroidales bacterium]